MVKLNIKSKRGAGISHAGGHRYKLRNAKTATVNDWG
jgi:hypothetical protein